MGHTLYKVLLSLYAQRMTRTTYSSGKEEARSTDSERKRERKEEGIILAGSGFWTTAKIKKEGKRKQNSWRQISSLTFKKYRSKGTERKTERDNSHGGGRKRGGRGGSTAGTFFSYFS